MKTKEVKVSAKAWSQFHALGTGLSKRQLCEAMTGVTLRRSHFTSDFWVYDSAYTRYIFVLQHDADVEDGKVVLVTVTRRDDDDA